MCEGKFLEVRFLFINLNDYANELEKNLGFKMTLESSLIIS